MPSAWESFFRGWAAFITFAVLFYMVRQQQQQTIQDTLRQEHPFCGEAFLSSAVHLFKERRIRQDFPCVIVS